LNFNHLIFLTPLSLLALRGDLVSYTQKAKVTQTEHQAICQSFSIDCTHPTLSNLYTFEYETLGVDQSPVTASSVLIIPQNRTTQKLLIYLHGTVSDKNSAPSHLGYHTQLPLSVFTQDGYNLVIPDYLGLGQSSTLFHPFCHKSTLATASYDAGLAALKLMNTLKLTPPSELYVSGYSEGGMAALALHQYLETHPIKNLKFKASSPMSGPYDLSSSLSFALNSPSPRMNTYMAYVISSYNRIYPHIVPQFNQVFVPQVSFLIPLLFDTCHPFLTINNILNKASPLLLPEFVKSALIQGSPFLEKLQENNTYQFAPKVKVHFVGLEHDSEVGFINSIQAYQYMKTLGCPVSLENASSTYDHIQGSPLCHMRAKAFFQDN
jgi:pimeloyl-ACP methyl ester carboxylesterase